MNILPEIAIKGMLVLAAAGLFTLCLRRASAAGRHLVWSVAVLTVLALPAVLALTPKRTVEIAEDTTLGAIASTLTTFADAATDQSRNAATSPNAGSHVDGNRAVDEPGDARETGGAGEPLGAPAATSLRESDAPSKSVARIVGGPRTGTVVTASPAAAAGTRRDSSIDPARLALAVWLAGVLLVLAALIGERLHLAYIRRRADRCVNGPVYGALERVAAETSLRRVPELRLGAADAMPMTWSFLRPVVLLPSSCCSWSRDRLETILRHELAHVRRRDDLIQMIATLVAALHWFDPFAWLAVHRLRVEREHACDDAVLRRGARPSAYAEELLRLATDFKAARATALAAQSMARPSQLSNRLLAVLADSRDRRSIGRRQVIAASLTGAMLLLPLSAIAFAIVPPGALGGVGLLGTGGEASGLPALPQDGSECWRRGVDRNVTNLQNTDDGVRTITWVSDNCRAEVRIEGEVYFNDSVTEIVGIEPRGEFRVEIDEGGTERRLEIRADAGGDLAYRYLVNGGLREDPGEGIAWLNGIMQRVLRATGIAAEERVAYIYQRSGADGVFDEVASMVSNSVKSRYLVALAGQSGIGNADLVRILETAAGDIGSNSSKGRVIGAVGRQRRDAIVGGALEGPFWRSASTIDSNSTYSRLLSGLIEGEPEDSALVTRALQEAGEHIDSNSTLANFLLRLERSYPGIATGGPQSRLFWETLNQVDSNSTVRGFLHELSAGEPIDSELLPIVFETALARINSNSTMRDFLVTMNQAYPDIAESGPLTDQFWAGVESVNSQSTLSDLLLDISRGRPDDSAVVERVLDTGIRGLSSASTKSRFLVDFTVQHREAARGRLHDRVLDAANAIGSRSNRERTLERLGDLGIG